MQNKTIRMIRKKLGRLLDISADHKKGLLYNYLVICRDRCTQCMAHTHGNPVRDHYDGMRNQLMPLIFQMNDKKLTPAEISSLQKFVEETVKKKIEAFLGEFKELSAEEQLQQNRMRKLRRESRKNRTRRGPHQEGSRRRWKPKKASRRRPS